ncbi:hypothetical protein [Bifidobacterium pullorum]|uniref:hypothetical protein n=1 Tax=Bifidobacterium pullorum TaxID=78448 RepID=UPI002430F944|nr:hypothetical protein [Bifidobacterium pullorum]
MSGAWDEILRHGRPVRELRDVAPGDVVFLENADASLMVAYRAGKVRRENGVTFLWVANRFGRNQINMYALGAPGSEMRFAGALRPAVDRREAARWQGI